MGRHIKAYKAGGAVVRRLADGGWYAMESIDKPSVVYVIKPDEIAIVDTDTGVRLSMNLIKELISVYHEAQDLKERGII